MGARILVADDSVTIQKVVELTFSKEDFVLTQARSGEEAIRKAKEMRPDLVLLDLVMPDMNGYDVCAALRTEPALRSVPIILLAGTFESFDQQRGTQAGANDVVTKPFESQILVGKVKQLLFARSLEAAAAAAPKPSADADTLKISSAPSVPAGPGVLQPPPVEPPLWAAPLPPAPIPAAARETLSMDLGSLDLEPVALDASQLAPLSVEAETLPLPESLSLDDLLATGPPAPPVAPRLEVPEAETVVTEPVFELSDTEAPPLAMVEAGPGEPPALSVEEFLAPPPSATADVTIVDLPQIDLTTLPEAITPPMTQQEPREPTSAEPGDAAPGLLLEEEIPASPEAPMIYQAAAPAVSTEIPPSILEEERPLSLLEAAESAAVATAMPASPDAAFVEDDVPRPALAPVAPEVPQTLPLGVAETDMAAMREAVTERVAHDLRRELSEKLLDRFEKIVWEVVPDLAEILITKEIERIRRLAEEEKSS